MVVEVDFGGRVGQKQQPSSSNTSNHQQEENNISSQTTKDHRTDITLHQGAIDTNYRRFATSEHNRH